MDGPGWGGQIKEPVKVTRVVPLSTLMQQLDALPILMIDRPWWPENACQIPQGIKRPAVLCAPGDQRVRELPRQMDNRLTLRLRGDERRLAKEPVAVHAPTTM